MKYSVICEDSRLTEAKFDTRAEAEAWLQSTVYPVGRWIEVSDICGWCGQDNILSTGESCRESDGCCGYCGAN